MGRSKQPCAYILASKSGVLYTGVTSDLEGRVWQHKNGTYAGFSKKYRCTALIWYEEFADIRDAIDREKQIKRWRREKKIWLIEETNPSWHDLAQDWFGVE
ncbi:MAG: GIY-YIG nuclease family protein [Armatimonadetes bacterium]|nr:GIY-YIG nuclease family protein [Armatimonadota bacterium]